MQGVTMTRRAVLRTALGALGACSVTARRLAGAAPPELALPAGTPEERFDFEATGLDGWTMVEGQWILDDMMGAPSGKRVLVQRATKNEFNVIVAPPGHTRISTSRCSSSRCRAGRMPPAGSRFATRTGSAAWYGRMR
jgi:hypothetical protein